MFQNLLLTVGLVVWMGSTAFAFEVAPVSSHAPAEGSLVARPVDLWIPPEDGVVRRRPPKLVSETIWNKYAKRPSAYANTGMRVMDPALTLPIPSYTPPPPAPRRTRSSKSRTAGSRSSAPAVRSAASASGVSAQSAVQKAQPAVSVAVPAAASTPSPQASPPHPPALPAGAVSAGETRHPVAPSRATPPALDSPKSALPPPKDTPTIYSEAAPAVGNAPPSAALQLASAPGSPVPPTPATPPAPPRKPSPVHSIAPNLTPDL